MLFYVVVCCFMLLDVVRCCNLLFVDLCCCILLYVVVCYFMLLYVVVCYFYTSCTGLWHSLFLSCILWAGFLWDRHRVNLMKST